jgi:hypothetical protein
MCIHEHALLVCTVFNIERTKDVPLNSACIDTYRVLPLHFMMKLPLSQLKWRMGKRTSRVSTWSTAHLSSFVLTSPLHPSLRWKFAATCKARVLVWGWRGNLPACINRRRDLDLAARHRISFFSFCCIVPFRCLDRADDAPQLGA